MYGFRAQNLLYLSSSEVCKATRAELPSYSALSFPLANVRGW